MVVFLLEILRYIMTLLFGTFLSAMFLNIEYEKRTVIILAGFSIADLALQCVLFCFEGVALITLLYPLITHLPLLIVFLLVFKKGVMPSIFAITTAYLCCQIANWTSMIPQTFQAAGWAVDLTYTLMLVITFVFIAKVLSPSFANLYQRPMAGFLTFAIIPGFYYVFDYLFTVYSELLYHNNMLVVEFAPFLLCLCYMFFCTVYFKQYEEKLEIEQHNRVMYMQQLQSEKEINAIKRSEKAISLLRHDMRHFLGTVSEYIETDQLDKAREYIRDIIEIADDTKQKRYCINDTVNMILSYYEETMTDHQIQFVHSLHVPSKLNMSDVDITAILSNGLENALHAVMPLPQEERMIELQMNEKSGKLLLSIENTFFQTPVFRDGLPIAKEKDHGFGTQSIRYTVEKLKGNCHFSVEGNRFVLQIII